MNIGKNKTLQAVKTTLQRKIRKHVKKLFEEHAVEEDIVFEACGREIAVKALCQSAWEKFSEETYGFAYTPKSKEKNKIYFVALKNDQAKGWKLTQEETDFEFWEAQVDAYMRYPTNANYPIAYRHHLERHSAELLIFDSVQALQAYVIMRQYVRQGIENELTQFIVVSHKTIPTEISSNIRKRTVGETSRKNLTGYVYSAKLPTTFFGVDAYGRVKYEALSFVSPSAVTFPAEFSKEKATLYEKYVHVLPLDDAETSYYLPLLMTSLMWNIEHNTKEMVIAWDKAEQAAVNGEDEKQQAILIDKMVEFFTFDNASKAKTIDAKYFQFFVFVIKLLGVNRLNEYRRRIFGSNGFCVKPEVFCQANLNLLHQCLEDKNLLQEYEYCEDVVAKQVNKNEAAEAGELEYDVSMSDLTFRKITDMQELPLDLCDKSIPSYIYAEPNDWGDIYTGTMEIEENNDKRSKSTGVDNGVFSDTKTDKCALNYRHIPKEALKFMMY